MCPGPGERTGSTFIDLEFGTGAKGGAALLGDVASSLVSLDELLRDLGSIAAYPSQVEFRKIEIVAIEMRSPLKVKLALLEISADAVTAFRELCRGVILFHERRSRQAAPIAGEEQDATGQQLAHIKIVLEQCRLHSDHITEQEALRIRGHIVTLQNAEVPLKRIEVKEE